MRKNAMYFAIGLFLASIIATATTINLPQIVTRTIQQAHVNDIRTALSVDHVPRNGAGTTTDVAGNLGSSTYRWNAAYATQFCIVYSSAGNAICHAAASAPGSAYTVTWPAALPVASNSFLVESTGGALSYVTVDGTTLQISAGVESVVVGGLTNISGSALTSSANFPGNSVQENGLDVVVASTNPSTSLKIIRGEYGTGGGVDSGEGFTVTKNSTGDNTINFSSSFASKPTVVAMCVPTTATYCTVYTFTDASTSSVRLLTMTAANAAIDKNVAFIAIGPR